MKLVTVTGAALRNSSRHPLGPHNVITASININSSLADSRQMSHTRCTRFSQWLLSFMAPSDLLHFTLFTFLLQFMLSEFIIVICIVLYCNLCLHISNKIAQSSLPCRITTAVPVTACSYHKLQTAGASFLCCCPGVDAERCSRHCTFK